MATHRRMRGRGFRAAFLGLLTGTLALLLPSFSPAVTPPPGTPIHNTATAAFGPPVPLRSASSNQTTVTADGAVVFWSPFRKSVDPSGQVAPGTTLRYTNTFGNAGPVALTNVAITDNLDAHLVYADGSATLPPGLPGASVAYDPASRRITWTIPSVPPGYSGQAGFLAAVDPATPSDTVIPNRIGAVSDQTPDPALSNLVTTTVVEQPLRISMLASRPEVEIGDTVLFVIRVENGGVTMTADNVVVTDVLPFGFRYVKGTSSIDNAAAADPSSGGARPAWAVGAMAPGQVRELRFRAVATGSALRGDGVSSATAAGRSPGGNPLWAGPAQCRVKVLEGVLGDRGVVLGRVFLDRDSDRMPGDAEPGLPGVRVWMEDGTFAETDAEGKYSIFGIRAGEHVLKLDRSTLPPGLIPVPLDATFAGDGGSRFVSLPFGGNARGDFALVPDPSYDNGCLPGEAAPAGKQRRVMTFGTKAPEEPPPLEIRIQFMDPTPEILEPADHAVLDRPYADVAVRVPDGSTDTLLVNGSEVPRKSIGKKIREAARKISIFQYVGVALAPGPNTITLQTVTPAGEKTVQTVTVNVPGPAARILLSPEKADVGADGREPVVFAVSVHDAFGRTSRQVQSVTVAVPGGKVDGPDHDPSTPGHQVQVVAGRATIPVRGTGETGRSGLKVTAGTGISAEAEIFFVPRPRPWVVAGIADVTAGANRVSGDVSNADDEETLKDGFSHDGRVALFAKGSVGKGYLLTASYDTAKEKTEPLFRREDPARYYPMYGDGSRIGYDAASGDKLFLKAERGRSYALYGDFRTDLTQTDFSRYDRAFTGGKADLDLGRFSVRAFGAETAQVLVRDDFRGNGTSGFYFLTRQTLVAGSERVRIEVRDRFHPERVLSTVEKAAHTDYFVDYDRGTILFKEPVPSLDAGMNPVHIVVLYESEGNGGEFYTYGGRAAVRPWKGLEIGATAVREDRNLETATLSGADATLRVGESLAVRAEAAVTDATAGGRGTAWRVEAEGAPTGKTEVSAYYRTVDREFENLSSKSAEPGTVKYGAKAAWRPSGETRFSADGYVEENETAGSKFRSAAAGVERRQDNVVAGAGYRYLEDERGISAGEGGDAHSVYASVSGRVTERATATLKHSQIVSGKGTDEYQTETGASLEYRLTDRIRANLAGTFQWTGERRQAAVFGFEDQVTDTTVLTSRYEIEDTASGERMQSLVGLNRRWSPRKDLKLDGRVEWIDYLKGADRSAEGIALALGAEYLPREDVKATGRTEVRFGDAETTVLLAAGAGWKVRPDLGLLARMRLWHADRDAAGDAASYDVLAGVAYRPKGVRSVYLLDTVRFVLDREEAAGGRTESRRIITSNEISWRVRPDLTLSGKYAGKYSWDAFEGDAFGTYSDLFVAGATYDVTERWDVGAHARLMSQYSADTRELSAVVRTGYRIVKNLYAGAGFNFARMNDSDFSGSGWQSHGPFVELKLKFDEATLRLPGWDDRPAPPPCPPRPGLPVPTARPVERPVEVVGSVEMPSLLVDGSEVPLPSADAFLAAHLPDGSLRFEGSSSVEPVTFRVEPSRAGTPAGWKLSITDAAGAAVRTLSGEGEPPYEIVWDARSEGGEPVEGGVLYRYQLETTYADNSVSLGGVRDFAVNRYSAISLNLTGSAFRTDSDVLSAKARQALGKMAEVLGRHPGERVTIEGHTDDVASEEYNLDLSRRRAQSAADFLVKEGGVAADRLDVRWYGESRPIAPNDSPEGRELNRRVELKGEFHERRQAAVRDRFRAEPSARINGASVGVDGAGRFRTKLPAGTRRIDVETTAADGRTVRTSLGVPSIRFDAAPALVRVPAGAALESWRIVVTGRTEPGNVLERDGRPVPVGPDGAFTDPVDLRSGTALAGYTATSPAGVRRILHLELGVSGAPGKGAPR